MTAGRPKRHSASFRRVLVLVYGTVILFALLITGIYTVVSPQIFASRYSSSTSRGVQATLCPASLTL